MEISITAALMPNVSGKILVCKQWGVGYQRFNGNKHDKKHKNVHKNTYKEIQNNQIKQIKKLHNFNKKHVHKFVPCMNSN